MFSCNRTVLHCFQRLEERYMNLSISFKRLSTDTIAGPFPFCIGARILPDVTEKFSLNGSM